MDRDTEDVSSNHDADGAPGRPEYAEPPASGLDSRPGRISSVSDLSEAGIGVSPVLFEPDKSTPLEPDSPDATIPPAALWAMEDRKHGSRLSPVDEDETIRRCLGEQDLTLYVMDDGRSHCMICRLVGDDDDGCIYCLVARVRLDQFEQLRDQQVALEDAFVDARDISLSAVFEGETASNVVPVQHYRRVEDVPVEYLPGQPFLHFSDDS
jgi:hypothetical protein